jgi:hypothetical protein
LKKTKLEEELKRAHRKCVLNIQPLVVRSPPYSSSSLECVEGKAYKEKIQFAQMVIQEINTIGTFTIEFLRRSKQCWCAK